MDGHNDNAPETIDLSEILAWLRAGSASAQMEVEEALATGLYYETQLTLASLVPDGDPDFFSEAAQRQPGETASDWAQRCIKGLLMNVSAGQAAAAASRGAARAAGILQHRP